MKIMYIIIGLAIIGLLIYFFSKNNKSKQANKERITKVDTSNNPYEGLREQTFAVSPGEIGLTETSDEKAYAIVMDIGMEEGTATVVSIIDGNASLYLSSGGGIIGGFGHESVKKAAIEFVSMANHYLNRMIPIDSFPLPQKDNVRFYILTNKAKYSIEEEIERIENDKSEWAELFYEGNKVLAELRLTADWK